MGAVRTCMYICAWCVGAGCALNRTWSLPTCRSQARKKLGWLDLEWASQHISNRPFQCSI